MKKIVAVLTLLVAFAFSANAQDQRHIDDAARKDANEIAKYLDLSKSQQNSFYELFQEKHALMQSKVASAERKAEMSKMIALKINASIDENQKEKLAKNPELLKRMTE